VCQFLIGRSFSLGQLVAEAINPPRGFLEKGHSTGAVTKVGTVRHGAERGRTNSKAHTVRTLTSEAREYLEQYEDRERKMELPCGHTGFVNIGEFLQCKLCGGRFTKAEITCEEQ